MSTEMRLPQLSPRHRVHPGGRNTMSFRWNHTWIALALAGATAMAPLAANAGMRQQTAEPREAPAGTRKDVRQDTRQIKRKNRDIRRDKRQLRATRARYGAGSPQAKAVHRDIRQDKRSRNRLRRDRKRDVRIHHRRVVRAAKH
jgi:hypothetical protein